MALDLQPAVRPTPPDAASGAPASEEGGGGLSLAERGKTADGAPQALDRRLFVQFLAYTDCPDPARLADAAEAAGFGIAQTLRRAGLAVDFALGGRSMKAQMKAADRSQAAVAVILGDDELTAGVAQVRDLGASEQRTVPIDQLALALTRDAM